MTVAPPRRDNRLVAKALLIVAAASAVLAVGCGGDSDTPEPEPAGANAASSTRASAGRICRAARQRIADATASLPSVDPLNPQPEQVKRAAAYAAAEVLPEYRAELDQLEALEPPADRRQQWNRFLRTLRAFVSKATANLEELSRTGSVARFEESLAERAELIDAAVSAAIRARVSDCAPS